MPTDPAGTPLQIISEENRVNRIMVQERETSGYRRRVGQENYFREVVVYGNVLFSVSGDSQRFRL